MVKISSDYVCEEIPDPLGTLFRVSSSYDNESGYVAYFLNSTQKYHRLDGPALVWNFKNRPSIKRYYIFDIEVNEKDFYTPGFIDAFILENS